MKTEVKTEETKELAPWQKKLKERFEANATTFPDLHLKPETLSQDSAKKFLGDGLLNE